ncbi:hypothetical protein FALCPG4_015072 [Fusarium falciforme]
MRIGLAIDQLQAGKIFTSLQTVRGMVNFELDRSTAITEVTVFLKGTLGTSLVKEHPQFTLADDLYTVSHDCHKILELSRVLFPENVCLPVPGGYTLAKGTYHFPFEIAFPLLSACQESESAVRHLATVLPPSFETHSSHHGTAKIEYFLEVKAKRPGRLQRDIAARHELIFLPFDPPLSSIMAGSGFCMTSGTLYINNVLCEGKQATTTEPSPGKIPILLLYATLPSPAVLYSEETVPLRLILRRLPVPTKDLYPIQLCSLAIRLQSRITITLGLRRTSWTSSHNLLCLTGLKRVVANAQAIEEESDISPLVNITIPKIAPSFTACTARGDYSLQVIAGFTFRHSTEISPIKIVINVEIHSGIGKEPHAAMTRDLGIYGNGRLNLVPLRVGCLEHLRAGKAITEEELPAYETCTR